MAAPCFIQGVAVITDGVKMIMINTELQSNIADNKELVVANKCFESIRDIEGNILLMSVSDIQNQVVAKYDASETDYIFKQINGLNEVGIQFQI